MVLNVFKNDDNTRDFTKENRHYEGKFRNPESPPPGFLENMSLGMLLVNF